MTTPHPQTLPSQGAITGALDTPMMPPSQGALDTLYDVPHDGGATCHCTQTSNINIYPSTSWGVLDAPCDTSIVGDISHLL